MVLMIGLAEGNIEYYHVKLMIFEYLVEINCFHKVTWIFYCFFLGFIYF